MRRVNELKILILTAATGGGHLRAAHTLQTYIQENTQGNEVVVADTLKEVSTILDKTCCDGYRFLARRTPRVFGRAVPCLKQRYAALLARGAVQRRDRAQAAAAL